jgi:hypothetical protein
MGFLYIDTRRVSHYIHDRSEIARIEAGYR